MKRLIIVRTEYGQHQTQGVLMVLDGNKVVYQCYTLELPWANNTPKMSCIPPGTYGIEYEYSNNFKSMLWELKGVPKRFEVKIHIGNYAYPIGREIEGCILPGSGFVDINGDGHIDIVNSRKALDAIHNALADITETTITIYGQP